MSASPKPGRDIGALLALMAALRTPKTGCPWDLEQSFATIAPFASFAVDGAKMFTQMVSSFS